jgi:hypothetical protein
LALIVSSPWRTSAGRKTVQIATTTLTKNDAPTQAPNALGFSRVSRNPSSAASAGENPDILILKARPHIRRNESASPLDARVRPGLPRCKAPLAIGADRC